MMYLNSRDLGMEHDREFTGKDEREIMRNFISFAESELGMPVLSAEMIHRAGLHIRRSRNLPACRDPAHLLIPASFS